MLRSESFILIPEAPWDYINEFFFEFTEEQSIYKILEEVRTIIEESINENEPAYETTKRMREIVHEGICMELLTLYNLSNKNE